MRKLIADGIKPKDDLLNMADVYFAVGRLTQEQYEDIVAQIKNKQEA